MILAEGTYCFLIREGICAKKGFVHPMILLQNVNILSMSIIDKIIWLATKIMSQ